MNLSRATIVGCLAQAITIALAWALVRRRPEHRPFAWWAAVVLAEDLARRALNAGPLNAPRPYTGALRLLFHLDQLLFLIEPVGLAVVAWIVFLHRRPRGPLLAGLAVWAALIVGYPWPFRGVVLGAVYAGVYAASVLACCAAMVTWTRRRAHPRPEHMCVLLATLILVVLFVGPFAPPAPRPFERWNSAELVYVSLWAALALVHSACLWFGFAMQPGGRDTSGRLH